MKILKMFRKKKEVDASDIPKMCQFLINMVSERSSDKFKWVNYQLWYFMQGRRLDEMTVDEVLEEWKTVCVPKMRRKRVLKELRKYIEKDRGEQESEESE